MKDTTSGKRIASFDSMRQIAHGLNVHVPTISREIKRNINNILAI